MTTEAGVRRQIDDLQEVLRRKVLTPEKLEKLRHDVKAIAETLKNKPDRSMHSLMELKGLGKELWRSIDVEAYLKQERDSWR
jgi:endonuclease III